VDARNAARGLAGDHIFGLTGRSMLGAPG
jgi:hypothetical protein